jgi:DNA polymerase-4
MDAFYASVEQRDNPDLQGKPVIVGGSSRRGVVTTASYEARRFGVKSAMPGFKARQLCPQGIFLPVRMAHYVAVSQSIMEVFRQFSPVVEPLSLDEAFLDMTGCERIYGSPMQMAEQVRRAIWDREHLTASVGVAANKFVAKIASDLNKPNGITECPLGQEKAFLAPLVVEKLWGVGPKSAARLHAEGLHTIGDIANADEVWLAEELGSFGVHLRELSHGRDTRVLKPDRTRKSIGSERTLMENIQGYEAVRERILPLVDEVCSTLRRKGSRAFGVRIKIRYASFDRHTRDERQKQPFDEAGPMLEVVERLLRRIDLEQEIRLVGVTAFDLDDDPEEEAVDEPRQMGLFASIAPVAPQPASSSAPSGAETPASAGASTIGSVMDRIHDRFGKEALARGAVVGRRRAHSPSSAGNDSE